MAKFTIAILKTAIALSLAGSLFVQFVLLALVWHDMTEAGEPLWGRVAFIAIAALGIFTMQVFAVCVWKLLTLVHKGSVFSAKSFRYVNIMIAAFGFASLLAFVLAVLLAPGEVAPGIVGLICGASLVLAGIALLVVVMRRLLIQAIAVESDAQLLRTELDGVI